MVQELEVNPMEQNFPETSMYMWDLIMTELVSKINVEKIDYLVNIIDKISSLH